MNYYFIRFVLFFFILSATYSCALTWYHHNLITIDTSLFCEKTDISEIDETKYSAFYDALKAIDKIAEKYGMRKDERGFFYYEIDGIEYKNIATYSRSTKLFETPVFVKLSVSTDYKIVRFNVKDIAGSKRETEFTKSLTGSLLSELNKSFDECQLETSVFYTPQGWFAP